MRSCSFAMKSLRSFFSVSPYPLPDLYYSSLPVVHPESLARPSHRHNLPLLILATTRNPLICDEEIANQRRRGKTRASLRYMLLSRATLDKLLLDRGAAG